MLDVFKEISRHYTGEILSFVLAMSIGMGLLAALIGVAVIVSEMIGV